MLLWPEGRDEFNGPHHLSSDIMTTLILFGASKSPIQASWPNHFEFGGGQKDWTGDKCQQNQGYKSDMSSNFSCLKSQPIYHL